MTNIWLTPAPLVRALGKFDLDPCAAPSPRPWPTAERHIELPEDGLEASWYGFRCSLCGWLDGTTGLASCCPDCTGTIESAPYRVYLNSPYGQETEAWLKKMSAHGSGIALIFARTETETWQKWVWPYAHSILFLEGRLYFHKPDGTRGTSNAGGPSALISYSAADTQALKDSGLKGALVSQWGKP